MSRTEDFRTSYQDVLDRLELPSRIALAYEPASCLAEREGRSVWLLRRRCDGAPFVLKTAGPDGEDLMEEFRLLSQLQGALAGAVPCPADCFAQGDTRYLLRSYLEGETLAQYRERGGDCGEAFCVRLGGQLCALLSRLHALSPPVIHRDVKPENIVLRSDGSVGLIDFGIARQYKPERHTDTRLMGSRSTAAPEQYGFSQTDERTDLYALGTTLIWLLTGSYDREALAGADVSPRLRRVLQTCTAFSPEDRYPDAGALGAALRRRGRRRFLLPAAACALICALLLGWALPGLGAAAPVSFPSRCLEAAVRAELDLPEGVPVTRGDLERVERLALVGERTFTREQAYRCTVESYIDEVSQLDAPRGDVSDLSLLARMPNLTELYLCQQEITDLSPLAGLPLKTLALTDNRIGDLSPLAALTGLEALWIGLNGVQDFTPLTALGQLTFLNIDGRYDHWNDTVPSLDFLRGMRVERLEMGALEPLDGDWSPLADMPRLWALVTWNLPPEAYEALGSMDRLTRLTLFDCQAEDLTALGGMHALEELILAEGPRSLEGVQALPRLIFLSLFGGASDLSPVAAMGKLEHLYLSNVSVTDFSPLAVPASLAQVTVDPEDAARVEADCPGHVFTLAAG